MCFIFERIRYEYISVQGVSYSLFFLIWKVIKLASWFFNQMKCIGLKRGNEKFSTYLLFLTSQFNHIYHIHRFGVYSFTLSGTNPTTTSFSVHILPRNFLLEFLKSQNPTEIHQNVVFLLFLFGLSLKLSNEWILIWKLLNNVNSIWNS